MPAPAGCRPIAATWCRRRRSLDRVDVHQLRADRRQLGYGQRLPRSARKMQRCIVLKVTAWQDMAVNYKQAMSNTLPLQIVYVLTNPAMPGLVKIGKTTQEEVDLRMKQLYSTGVPVPLECVFACRVPDASVVEKAFHHAFGQVRINPTQWFSTETDRVGQCYR